MVHNAACAAAGIDAVYLPFLIPKGHLGDFLKEAKRWPLVGLSVTIPHKESVIEFASSQGELVEEIGAANTISFVGETKEIKVANTDGLLLLQQFRSLLQHRMSALVDVSV